MNDILLLIVVLLIAAVLGKFLAPMFALMGWMVAALWPIVAIALGVIVLCYFSTSGNGKGGR